MRAILFLRGKTPDILMPAQHSWFTQFSGNMKF
jgi:hypothetical protein